MSLKPTYLEPILMPLSILKNGAPFQNSALWGFEFLKRHERGRASEIVHRLDVSEDWLEPFLTPPAGMDSLQTLIMGILNITPDSFSDGGVFSDFKVAMRHARAMIASGASIIDIGAESTRPGATTLSDSEELARFDLFFENLSDFGAPVSIDTRKARVAESAIRAGAFMINDVSAGLFDSDMLDAVARTDAHICLMHTPAGPETMQNNPSYDHVLLDVYDALASRVTAAVDAGIKRELIIVDPGIGFGKNLEHNLVLMQHAALFHGLGCRILYGVSRKSFIKGIDGTEDPLARIGGSLAAACLLAARGVHILRVHDVQETIQAIRVQNALIEANYGT